MSLKELLREQRKKLFEELDISPDEFSKKMEAIRQMEARLAEAPNESEATDREIIQSKKTD